MIDNNMTVDTVVDFGGGAGAPSFERRHSSFKVNDQETLTRSKSETLTRSR